MTNQGRYSFLEEFQVVCLQLGIESRTFIWEYSNWVNLKLLKVIAPKNVIRDKELLLKDLYLSGFV